MSVYIKGMEIPGSCFDCPFMLHRSFCLVNTKIEFTDEEYQELKGRYIGCPLVPVPPHGDLIDRDALLDTATIHWSQTTNESCFPIDEIEYAPTIIPASEEGE